MARLIGSTFTGTADGLSFYHDRLHGYLVRRTGGVTSKQYRNDKRYAAARDASSEFSNVSRAGKLIREAFGAFAQQVKDGTMVNRMNKELVALKQLDKTHFRGERRPEAMMTDQQANLYFRIFQFNDARKLYDLTERYPQVEQRQDLLAAGPVCLKPDAFPEGATHAGITLVRTVIDFDHSCYRTSASTMAVVTKGEQQGISPVIADLPSVSGTEIICLQVVFFRMQGGDLVQLQGRVDSMGIVSVNNEQLAVNNVQLTAGRDGGSAARAHFVNAPRAALRRDVSSSYFFLIKNPDASPRSG